MFSKIGKRKIKSIFSPKLFKGNLFINNEMSHDKNVKHALSDKHDMQYMLIVILFSIFSFF